jgi:hypothetical protein
MSSDATTASSATAAADFFKNKKKKGKKVFTFNANLVDADTVTQTIHVYVVDSHTIFQLNVVVILHACFFKRISLSFKLFSSSSSSY